jgi:hypothetical protein
VINGFFFPFWTQKSHFGQKNPILDFKKIHFGPKKTHFDSKMDFFKFHNGIFESKSGIFESKMGFLSPKWKNKNKPFITGMSLNV